MHMLYFVLALLITLLPYASSGLAQGGAAVEEGVEVDFSPRTSYQAQDILGWTLQVHENLLADEELAEQTLAEIHHQLYRISRIMPEDKLEHLRQVTLWVELENPQGGTACYHPSRQWLEENQHLPDKAQGVEIGNAREFLRYTQRNQPFVLLHELAHAYHHRVLGFDHPQIVASYERIVEAGIYEDVLFIDGKQNVRHYALTNHKEFFAESTESFFGQNDFYPFVQGELYVHDRETYDMLVEIWGIEPGQ